MRLIFALLAGLVFSAAAVLAGPPDIQVEGLMTDAAVINIDGQRKMLRVGQSFAGVTLLAVRANTATLEVDGRQMVLGLSRRVGTKYQEPEQKVVTIQRNAMLQYQTNAAINGRNVLVLVDTGANFVALNSSQATSLGVTDYQSGIPGQVETASGMVNAWQVKLRSVEIGGIRVNNVEAMVIEGDFPSTVLLGMTYLRHVQMTEKNGVLTLSRAH